MLPGKEGGRAVDEPPSNLTGGGERELGGTGWTLSLASRPTHAIVHKGTERQGQESPLWSPSLRPSVRPFIQPPPAADASANDALIHCPPPPPLLPRKEASKKRQQEPRACEGGGLVGKVPGEVEEEEEEEEEEAHDIRHR